MVNKQLRAVVYGGGEPSGGCGPTCEKDHRRDGNCLVCGQSAGRPFHRHHSCLAGPHRGKRGSWKAGGGGGFNFGSQSAGAGQKKSALSLSAEEFFGMLTDEEDAFAKVGRFGVLPSPLC